MKRIASIGLILIMSLQCCYKLGVITYFQLNRDYIASVLCINKSQPAMHCHGQCFLKNKLNLGDDKQSDEPTLPPSQHVDLPVFLITMHYFSFMAGAPDADMNARYLSKTSAAHSAVPFHPPTQQLSLFLS